MARNWTREDELRWMEEEQREMENDPYTESSSSEIEEAYREAMGYDPSYEWNID